MVLTRKRIISERKLYIDENVIDKVELREYKLINCHGEENFSIVLYVNTNLGEIEVDYLGKLTKDKEKFEECFNFLCNYNGISSTLNRVIIEIKKNAD